MAAFRWMAMIVALAAPHLVPARPAVVRSFEVEARDAPRPDAPVVQRFSEGAELSVSEEAQDGWRRVRLPDGRVAWIEDARLALRDLAAPPAFPAPPPFLAPLALPADLRPRVFVDDVDHLAALVRSDPAVGPKAQALVDRRTRSFVVFGIGAAASVGALVAGAHQMTAHAPAPGDPDFGRTPPGQGLVLGGLVGLAASSLIAALLHPTQGDVLDVLNAWNGAHPDRPLELVRAPHPEHPAHVERAAH